MKVKVISCSLFLAAAFVVTALIMKSTGAAGLEPKQLALSVRSDHNAYLPGEPVNLKFKVTNKTDAPVSIDGGADVWHGQLKVFIAYQDESYKEYLGPRWGLKDELDSETVIEPNGFFDTEATILYNHPLQSAHLSALYATENAAKRVETEYALARVGEYRLKAVLHVSESEGAIESAPVQITIEAPKGDDLAVWNKIKDNPSYGYFIQTGDLKARPNSRKAGRVVETLEEVVNSKPNSRYAGHIRQSLAKFKSSVDDLKKRGIVKQDE
jgi:hypothetical protein